MSTSVWKAPVKSNRSTLHPIYNQQIGTWRFSFGVLQQLRFREMNIESTMSSSVKSRRREFLTQAGQAAVGLVLGSALPVSALAAGSRRLKVAAVITEFSYRSHAHVILENFVEPYLFNGKWVSPGMDVVSLYADQFPDGDLGRAFAAKHKIPIYQTISEALGLGGEKLAVDA